MDNASPQISIIMPIFNHADLVIEMLESIRNNTFTDWELLAIDDGSDDADFNAISEYTSRDARIRYQKRDREPKGAPTCRNIGLDLAQGKYVIFFDSDDWITPSCLQQRFDSIEQRPDLDFMVFRSGTYCNGGISAKPSHSMFGFPIYNDDLSAFCSRNLPFIVWNNIYKRDSLINANIKWDERLKSLQDQAFNLRSMIQGLRYAYSDSAPDYAYRIAVTGSVSKRIGDRSHYVSNTLATELAYSMVQNKYGHKYDRDLYLGALYVYTKTARTNLDIDFMSQMTAVIRRHSPGYGRLFAAQMLSTRCLSHIFPEKIARQLPMPLSLFRFWYMKKFWVPNRIARMLQSS